MDTKKLLTHRGAMTLYACDKTYDFAYYSYCRGRPCSDCIFNYRFTASNEELLIKVLNLEAD